MNDYLEKILCIIPARGGSKGIPDKNIKLLSGIPLVAHSILHAIYAGVPKKNIILSSDSQDILKIANDYDIRPLERPSFISGDNSPTEDALLHALDYATKKDGVDYSSVLLLQPTSPIRFIKTINGFLDFSVLSSFDSCLATTMFYDFFWEADGSYGVSSSYDFNKRPMRQGLRKYKHFDCGNMYFTRTNTLLENRCRLGNCVGIFNISHLEGLQIDTLEDFEIIDSIYSGKITDSLCSIENPIKNVK